jgi:hypothetical protein
LAAVAWPLSKIIWLWLDSVARQETQTPGRKAAAASHKRKKA